MTRKFCIFCGKKPEAKTKEHVLPLWLIQLTGSPERVVYLGTATESRFFRFNSYKFPACASCNAKYADFEARAQAAIESLLAGGGLTVEGWHTLLDWLDKVRIGLWLGSWYMDKSIRNIIDPAFHIEARVGLHDRAVVVWRAPRAETRLSVFGPCMPTFMFAPSAFGLVINSLIILNVSMAFLLSYYLGIPYAANIRYVDNGRIECDMKAGREKIKSPPWLRLLRPPARLVMQAMFPQVSYDDWAPAEDFYSTAFVHNHSINADAGIGEICLCDGKCITCHIDENETILGVTAIRDTQELNPHLACNVLSLHNYMEQHAPSLEDCSKEFQKAARKSSMARIRFNRILTEAVKRHPDGMYGELGEDIRELWSSAKKKRQ